MRRVGWLPVVAILAFGCHHLDGDNSASAPCRDSVVIIETGYKAHCHPDAKLVEWYAYPNNVMALKCVCIRTLPDAGHE